MLGMSSFEATHCAILPFFPNEVNYPQKAMVSVVCLFIMMFIVLKMMVEKYVWF